MQSSSNRLPLDRNDGINSGLKNERDLAAIFYWAPKHIRERFSWLNRQGLKGSGDYGVVGLGVFNGQTANQPEKNDEPHVVARFTWPFQFENGQILEASIQGYGGEYVINSNLVEDKSFDEMRFAGTLVYYPQPFGFQVEYNFGHGPEFVPEKMTVENRDLHGGYVQSMYYLRIKDQLFIPFARWHIYEGGKKHQLDATSHRVNEQEIGVEWQPNRSFELVVMYTISDRTFENSLMPDNHQQGSLLRIQAQVNY
jgi:hypothetical protein